MKKINNAAKLHRSFRRLVRQLFSSFIKLQNRFQKDKEKIIKILRDTQGSIEIIARQIARWVESGE
jgi:hypothetical protein